MTADASVSRAEAFGMPDEKLAAAIIEGRGLLSDLKQTLSIFEDELSKRQTNNAKAVLDGEGKQYGTTTFTFGKLKLKAEAKKSVSWDSDKLKAIAGSLPWPVVERMFDIEFSIPERVYSGIVDQELLDKIDAARTTKYGDMKVTLVSVVE